jgi:hypothetical protein
MFTFRPAVEYFQGCADRKHPEAVWIVKIAQGDAKEAFSKTSTPLGAYFAGLLQAYSASREKYDFFKKSAEGGCSWGQVEYAKYFRDGRNGFEEKNRAKYVELLEKAAQQNNPKAMDWLGNWYRDSINSSDTEMAMSYFRAAAELGWKDGKLKLATAYRDGVFEKNNWNEAFRWGADYGEQEPFFGMVQTVYRSQSGPNIIYYAIGRGLYWHVYGSKAWNCRKPMEREQYLRCLHYYCDNVDIQKKSVWTFLWCWNQIVGVKDVGVMIGKLVWGKREECMILNWVGYHSALLDGS